MPVTVNGASNSAKTSVDKAVLEEGFDKNEVDSSGINKVTVLMPEVKNVKSFGVELPADILSSEKAERAIEISTGIATVTVPENMLKASTGIEKVLLTVASGDISGLDESVRAQIGAKPVVELSLKADGEQTDWSNEKAPVTITIPYEPTAEELNNPDSIIIWYIDGKGRAVCVPNGHYDADTGTVTFTAVHFSCYAVGYNPVAFNDVTAGSWYYKAVSFIAARGVTTGTESGNFDPGSKLTRGEFLTMLMRACGIAPDENPSDNFADAGNTYYTGCLAAAKRLGITAGLGDNLYAPDQEISRQEMFTLLYNSLKLCGSLPQGSSGQPLSAFRDADKIAGWAKEAMEQMAANGIAAVAAVSFLRQDTATRAEMAQILYNLLSR